MLSSMTRWMLDRADAPGPAPGFCHEGIGDMISVAGNSLAGGWARVQAAKRVVGSASGWMTGSGGLPNEVGDGMKGDSYGLCS